MCLSAVIDLDYSQVSGCFPKREYKDEEKKIIKNKKIYCFLILFYTPPTIIRRKIHLSKTLKTNNLQITKTYKRL